MENDDHFTLRTGDRVGFDVEVWNHEGHVWLSLDPNGWAGRSAQRMSAEQAREVAAALLRFADRVEDE